MKLSPWLVRAVPVALALAAGLGVTLHANAAASEAADLRLTRASEQPVDAVSGIQTIGYSLVADNLGPAAFASFTVTVTTAATATIRIGETTSSGTICRAVTTCQRTFTAPPPDGTDQPVEVRVSAAPGTRVTMTAVAVGAFTDPRPRNNTVRRTIPSTADLTLAAGNESGEIINGTVTMNYSMTTGNGGPAMLPGYTVTVATAASATIRIGETTNSGTICRGVTECSRVVETLFGPGTDRPVEIRVTAAAGTRVTVTVTPAAPYTDPEPDDNAVRDRLPR
jgi:hypothetical protein